MNQTVCRNCQNSFNGNYCSQCCQRSIGNSRLKMREVINDFFDNTFNIQKGFLFTFWNLIIRPGHVALAYIDGKRKAFTNPTRYMVIALAFQTFIDYWFKTTEVIKNETYYIFPFLSDEINKSMEIWNVKLAIEYILFANLFMIVAIPALFLLFFKKLKFNYTELLAASFYFIPTILFINMPVLLITKVGFGILVTKEVIIFIFLTYIFWSYFSFFREVTFLRRIIKIIVVIVLFMFLRIFLLPFILSLMFTLS